jgi:hypothetical protein
MSVVSSYIPGDLIILERNRVVGRTKVANWIIDPLLPNFFILFLSPSILFSGLSCLDVCGQFCVES